MNNTNNSIPVTLIRGFLEAGKTTLINRLLCDEDFSGHRLLLISCEEGEVEFDERILNKENVNFVQIEDEDLLTREYLEELSAQYAPSMVMIECNVMWKMIEFELPRNWTVTKRTALLCGPTLGVYLDNMRSFLGPMLSRCDEILITQCQSPAMLIPSKAKLRPLLDDVSRAAIDVDGEYFSLDSVEDTVPYPLDSGIITISPEHYVYWYYDVQDHPERYENRRIAIDGDIKKSPVLKDGEFALGRIAITCCEADMSFLGFIAHSSDPSAIEQYARVHAEAVVTYRFMKNYNAVKPYLEVTHIEAQCCADCIVSY